MRLMVRGDKAFFTVPCLEGESHSVILGLDGNLESRIGSHDFDDERVIEMLGGEPTSCAKIRKIYDTAMLCYKIQYGLADPVGVVSNSDDEFWTSEDVCSFCASSRSSRSLLKALSHFASAEHTSQVAGIGEYSSLFKRLVKWFERKGLLGIDSVSELSFDTPDFAYILDTDIPPSPLIVGGVHYFRSRSERIYNKKRYMLTPRYVKLAESFVGKDFDSIFILRSFMTIEKLEEILNQVGDRTIAYIRNKMFRKNAGRKNFATMLMANRSVSNSVIIDFLKAGIYANIYTYANNNATAHQAVRIYEASGGEKTLKDYLLEGVSAVEAVILAEGLAAVESSAK
jgi:hypothetical protein